MLLLGCRSFTTVLLKESVIQSSEGPWMEERRWDATGMSCHNTCTL